MPPGAGPPCDDDDRTPPPGLRCPGCGRSFAAGPGEPWRCTCGHPLELDAGDVRSGGAGPGSLAGPDPAGALPAPDAGVPPAPGDLDRDRGLWAFDEFLPVEPRVTLGEGWTPLVAAPAWDATFKLEWVFPTGSFKDRGAATTLSRAAGLGVDRVLEDSSGNAGAAVATYAARAGIDARIYVPADADPAKLAAIERTGADVVPVDGSRADVTDACVAAAAADEGWYASHAWRPSFLAGTATFAFEVCARRDWAAPDAVVCPVGHGTLFLGAYRGFRALREAGWIAETPRLLAAQAAGVAPLVADLHGAAAAVPEGGPNHLADGVQIAGPARRAELREAVEATGGDAVAVDEDATRVALDRLHRGGCDVEPTSALAPAALDRFRERGSLDADADVVVPLTGSGLKYAP